MRLGTPSWQASVRIARRDALRRGSRGRTALIAAMIGLPVAVVTATSALVSTSNLTQRELVDDQLGPAVAQIIPAADVPVIQDNFAGTVVVAPDAPQTDTVDHEDPRRVAERWTPTAVQRETGGRVIVQHAGEVSVAVDAGIAHASVLETDFQDPVVSATVTLLRGRLPAAPGEVAISPTLERRGPAVGEQLAVEGAHRSVTVVGVVDRRDRVDVYAAPDTLHDAFLGPLAAQRFYGRPVTYLLDRGAPLPWSEVLRLNRVGLAAYSRAVVEDPPSTAELSPAMVEMSDSTGDWQSRATLIILFTGIVIEVTLLAGPAFAVGVRRQRRILALVGATGGTPPQVARVVLAQAVVIGLSAAVSGAVLGIGVAAAAVAVLRHRDPLSVGPWDVVWWQPVGCVLVGAASALMAAWFPARQAARTDVVLELAGRRPRVTRSWGRPLVTAVVLAVGAALATPSNDYSEFWAVRLSIATIVLLIGGIFAIPTLLALTARAAGRLPLAFRLAARDTDRHRSRSTPAAAAIMATVAVLTALGIASFSDQEENQVTYLPELAAGVTKVEGPSLARDQVWARAGERASAVLGPATLSPVGYLAPPDDPEGSVSLYLAAPGCPDPARADVGDQSVLDCLQSWQTPDDPAGTNSPAPDRGARAGMSSSLMVGHNGWGSTVADPAALAGLGWDLTAEQRAVLESGGVLVPRAESIGPDGRVTLSVHTAPADDPVAAARPVTVKAKAVVGPVKALQGELSSPGVTLTPATARALELPWARVAGLLLGATTPDEDRYQAVDAAMRAVADDLWAYTERGPGPMDERALMFLLLLAGGGTLVLIGTFTATGLAMSDARPDLSTLSAVGADPRVRRTYSAAQALVPAVLGASTGVVLGFLPGLAATWPLTAEGAGQTPIIDIPWLLLATLAVGVPALAALVAAACTRSRLPIVRRLAQ